jgi:hypothetical protein
MPASPTGGMEVIFNPTPRATALREVAPLLEGELWRRGLAAAMSLPADAFDSEHSYTRVQLFASFLDNAPPSQKVELQKFIRQTFINFLYGLSGDKRDSVLGYRSTYKLFVPLIISTESINIISAHMIEICRDWRWV